MTYTQNYQLPQWVKSDRIMMDDFNDANSKIDTALHGLRTDVDAHETANTAAHAAFGNCQVVTGTYTGQGRCGADTPNTLTFPHKPLLVIIHPDEPISSSNLTRLLLLQGSTFAFSYMDMPPSQCRVSWSGSTVSWYNNTTYTYQCDQSGDVYRYVALLDMEN